MTRDFTAAHQQMAGSMQHMFDQMHQFHAEMNDVMKNPALMHNDASMKAFRMAGDDFQKMGKAFESMLKNMSQVMKGIK